MIQLRTKLVVADNSGAKRCQCIGIHHRGNSSYASIGDVIVMAVKEAMPRAGVKKGEIVKGVVVRVRKPLHRNDGSCIKFDENAVVLIDNEGNPRGTRVFGPVARELRDRDFVKIVSLAPEVY